MRGIKFGVYHTADDWGLILNAKTINPPAPKYVKISVDGRDGDLNLSRTLTGDMKYSNREASFTFLVTDGSQEERAELINEIVNLIHGNELQIIEPDDPDHYLLGECSVNSIQNNKAYGSFIVSADCEPYRYAIEEIKRTITASATESSVVLTNSGRKTLIPTVTVTGTVNLTIGTTKVSLGAGTYKLTSLILRPGSNVVGVSGSGAITFTYREWVI
jgi:hypothetical protein